MLASLRSDLAFKLAVPSGALNQPREQEPDKKRPENSADAKENQPLL